MLSLRPSGNWLCVCEFFTGDALLTIKMPECIQAFYVNYLVGWRSKYLSTSKVSLMLSKWKIHQRIYYEQIIRNINFNDTCSGYNSLYWICHCIALTTPMRY